VEKLKELGYNDCQKIYEDFYNATKRIYAPQNSGNELQENVQRQELQGESGTRSGEVAQEIPQNASINPEINSTEPNNDLSEVQQYLINFLYQGQRQRLMCIVFYKSYMLENFLQATILAQIDITTEINSTNIFKKSNFTYKKK